MLKTKLHARDNHAYEQPLAPIHVILYIKAYDTDQYRYTLFIPTTNIIMKAKAQCPLAFAHYFIRGLNYYTDQYRYVPVQH